MAVYTKPVNKGFIVSDKEMKRVLSTPVDKELLAKFRYRAEQLEKKNNNKK